MCLKKFTPKQYSVSMDWSSKNNSSVKKKILLNYPYPPKLKKCGPLVLTT